MYEYTSLDPGSAYRNCCWMRCAELMLWMPEKPEYREVVFSLVRCNRKAAHSPYLEKETAVMYRNESVKEYD